MLPQVYQVNPVSICLPSLSDQAYGYIQRLAWQREVQVFFLLLFKNITHFHSAWNDFLTYVVGPLTGVEPLCIFPQPVDIGNGRCMVDKEAELEILSTFEMFLRFMGWQGTSSRLRFSPLYFFFYLIFFRILHQHFISLFMGDFVPRRSHHLPFATVGLYARSTGPAKSYWNISKISRLDTIQLVSFSFNFLVNPPNYFLL